MNRIPLTYGTVTVRSVKTAWAMAALALALSTAALGSVPRYAPPPPIAPENGALAIDSAADSAQQADSIVAEADSAAQAVLAESAQGGAETAGPEAQAAPPLWLETYGEGVYSRHEDDNLAGFTDWKVGKRLPGPLQADLYAKIRVYRDQRDFYWNNRADGGVGARISLLRKVSLIAFAEGTWGRYLSVSRGAVPLDRMQGRIGRLADSVDAMQVWFHDHMYDSIFNANSNALGGGNPSQDRKALELAEQQGDTLARALLRLHLQADSLETAKDSLRQAMDSIALIPAGEASEFKVGLVFWHGWGAPDEDATPAAWLSAPMRFWGDVYADCIYSSLSRHVLSRRADGEYHDSTARFRNLILYANPSLGFVVLEGKLGSMVAYAGGYAWFDTHKDWWNNLAMAGPGLRYIPFRRIDLSVKAEWMWGGYYGRERVQEPNPYGKTFSDTRVTASFWHGLGL
ncbi:MAG: hypothetical protein JF616_03450 [Fibrobacteres bacterium]|nr:hypothetical protein [Fibrobacterota bacterium]